MPGAATTFCRSTAGSPIPGVGQTLELPYQIFAEEGTARGDPTLVLKRVWGKNPSPRGGGGLRGHLVTFQVEGREGL